MQVQDVEDVKGLLRAMLNTDDTFINYLKEKFSFEGKKLFDNDFIEEKSEAALTSLLVSELNIIIESDSLKDNVDLSGKHLSTETKELLTVAGENDLVRVNRRLLEDGLWSYIERKTDSREPKDEKELTILDVILGADVRDHFIVECQNLITFSVVYENLIADLVAVARQAHESRTLPEDFIEQLIDRSVAELSGQDVFAGQTQEEIKERFANWIQHLSGHSRCAPFLKSVEEWIRIVHPDKSEALFVVISFFFEKLLPEYYASQRSGKRYEGKIAPVRIGRRKDFWNRLTIAYRDLLFHEILTAEKRTRRTSLDALLEKYVENFNELNATLMSADPVAFPTFRPSIETAFKNDVRPYGLVTGIGDFKTDNGCYRAGLVISNLDFQVGCIDNSDCERFCKLLVECAIQRLPVICFVSSGGMQTKEGA
ncbi:MAG: carbamoyl-phosphate synthase large subunit, partial [Pseudomonadales bacterium]|nr:carbamoyl-phosphate synthase large subunit [Pseudomonadales bacterium]